MCLILFSAMCSDLSGWDLWGGCGYTILSLIEPTLVIKFWPRFNPISHPALSVYELLLCFDYLPFVAHIFEWVPNSQQIYGGEGSSPYKPSKRQCYWDSSKSVISDFHFMIGFWFFFYSWAVFMSREEGVWEPLCFVHLLNELRAVMALYLNDCSTRKNIVFRLSRSGLGSFLSYSLT